MILDTCSLLWLAQGGGKLSKTAARRIDAEPVVYVSAISGFEVGIKYRQGKLELPATPADWFDAVIRHHGLSVMVLDLAVCIRATELPDIHRDPCDRMIIASAQIHQLPVVTPDPLFSEYDVEVVW
jgi:PIN domain nuclease of toxin-antitoxin system